MVEPKREYRRVVFEGGFYTADSLFADLLANAKRQIFITAPSCKSPVLKYLDKVKSDVDIIISCPINEKTIELMSTYDKRIKVIPDKECKGLYLAIDGKDSYLLGYPKDKKGEEFISVSKLNDYFIIEAIFKRYNINQFNQIN